MSVGERIAKLRKEKNISQGELADALEITRQAVSKWENGLAYPDTVKLIKLAEVLESDVEYLATGRNTVLRRPPIVIKSVETVEKIVEKPVYQIVEKIIEMPVETPVYIEKPVIQEVPVIKKVYRVRYRRSPLEYAAIACLGFIAGLLIGFML